MSDHPSLSVAKRKLLESYRAGSMGASAAIPAQIRAGASDGWAPLAPSQEQLFLRETSIAGIPALYNECVTLQMKGPIDVPALERSFTDIVRRHEIWRTSYRILDGRPVQIVQPGPERVRFPVEDLSGLSNNDQDNQIRERIGREVSARFDLFAGPLWRTRLIRTGEFEYRLYLVAHLSIVDGVSVYQIFPSELATLYRAYSSGQPAPLRSLPIQFGDYARWQRGWLLPKAQATQLTYWRTQLAGNSALNWPADSRPGGTRSFRGKIRQFRVRSAIAQVVKAMTQRDGATLFMSLLAALVALLYGYTEQNDFVVGTPSPAGRKRSEVQALLGYFLNPVALRFTLHPDLSFRQLLRQAQRLTLEAIANDDVPYELVARELQPRRDPIRCSPLTIGISLQPPTPALGMPWSVTSMDVETGGSPWDLYLAFIDAPNGLLGRVQYNPDLFGTPAIDRLLRDYAAALDFFCMDPSQPISEAAYRRMSRSAV